MSAIGVASGRLLQLQNPLNRHCLGGVAARHLPPIIADV